MSRIGTRHRPLRQVLAVLLAMTLIAAACSDDDGASGEPIDLAGWLDRGTVPEVDDDDDSDDEPEPADSSTIEWTTEGSLHRGTLEVPLDHDDPDGDTIELAIARRPAAKPDERIGVLLVNPGGPGASGLEIAGFFGFLFSQELRDRFDIIAWDPRGVGESTNVVCGDGEFMDRYVAADPVPPTPEARAEAAALAQQFAELCDADSGDLLPHIHTEASARDMDVIRRALGEDQISYVGFSYGTFLGASYAELFPDRMRAFVLDGAFSRSVGQADMSEGQAMGFEGSLNTFFEWCRNRSCPFDDGGDLGASFDSLMESIRSEPLPTDDADGRDLTVGLAWTGALAAMYSPQLWTQLDRALASARDNGDGSALLRLADFYLERAPGGEYASLHYAFTAYNCMDAPLPTPAEEAEAVERVLAAAPRVGPVFVSGSSPCEFWPVEPKGTTEPFSVPDAPPILVIATTGDPATPYPWGVQLAEELETSVLLTVEGDTHTAFGGGNACVDNIVEQFLITATIASEEQRCAA